MYDLVIFDMPPILAVTDAQIMQMYVMLLFLLFVSESTEKETAVKAKGLLESAKGKLLGVVLNVVNVKKAYIIITVQTN